MIKLKKKKKNIIENIVNGKMNSIFILNIFSPEIVKSKKEDEAGFKMYSKSQKDKGKNVTQCRKEWNSFSDSQKEVFLIIIRNINKKQLKKKNKQKLEGI